MSVTFVTAFLRPKTSYRSVEKYFSEFQKLAGSGVPIVLFLDNEFCHLEFPSNVRVIPTSLDTSWVPNDVVFPIHRNEHKDTLEYFCIQLMKLRCLVDALQYTEATHLAWIDFGIFHMFRNPDECVSHLQTISISQFPTGTILAPGCWQPGLYDFDSICWRYCGSFLLGDRAVLADAYDRQTNIVFSHFPLLTWEVNYWSRMDDVFTHYSANHDDSLLQRVMTFVQRHQGV